MEAELIRLKGELKTAETRLEQEKSNLNDKWVQFKMNDMTVQNELNISVLEAKVGNFGDTYKNSSTTLKSTIAVKIDSFLEFQDLVEKEISALESTLLEVELEASEFSKKRSIGSLLNEASQVNEQVVALSAALINLRERKVVEEKDLEKFEQELETQSREIVEKENILKSIKQEVENREEEIEFLSDANLQLKSILCY